MRLRHNRCAGALLCMLADFPIIYGCVCSGARNAEPIASAAPQARVRYSALVHWLATPVVHSRAGSDAVIQDLSQFAWFDATATRASADELLR